MVKRRIFSTKYSEWKAPQVYTYNTFDNGGWWGGSMEKHQMLNYIHIMRSVLILGILLHTSRCRIGNSMAKCKISHAHHHTHIHTHTIQNTYTHHWNAFAKRQPGISNGKTKKNNFWMGFYFKWVSLEWFWLRRSNTRFVCTDIPAGCFVCIKCASCFFYALSRISNVSFLFNAIRCGRAIIADGRTASDWWW